jgi:heme-degrading monooxygenase HmoA
LFSKGEAMLVVIFEVQPEPGRTGEYLKLAQHLRPMLEKIDGFLDVERFASRRTEGRLLSLSTWRDEQALVQWRSHAEHRRVQARGRTEVFQDYRLRVGMVTADTKPPTGARAEQAPSDATRIDAGKALTISELVLDPKQPAPADPPSLLGPRPETAGLVDREAFASIYTPGKIVLLASWHDAAAARAWTPESSRALRHRHIRILRDYGMFDRREAPQFYPARERLSLA